MIKKIISNLGFWIILTMVLGIVAGSLMGENASIFAPFGKLFIQLIKMLVVPLVGLSIISGAASLGNSRSAGMIGVVSITFIMITTLIAVAIGIGAGIIFTPGEGIEKSTIINLANTEGLQTSTDTPTLSFWDTIIGMIPENPIAAFAEGNILQIIVFGLFLGFGIAFLQEQKRTKIVNGINYLLEALIWCVSKVMWIAPIGVFGLMAEAVGNYGFDILMKLVNLLWVYVLCVAVVEFIIYPLIVKTGSKVKVGKFMKDMVDPQLIAFSTASSMVTLPINMETCTKKLGVSKQTAGFVLPLGATINMTGNAIYYSLVAVFFAQIYGIDLTISQYLSIAIVSTLGSIGQAGVPGPTLMVAAVLVGAGIPIDGLPILYALDRVFDMIRTTLNITGDAACAIVTDHFVNKSK